MRKRRRRILILLFLLCGALPCIGLGCADQLILGSDHDAIDPGLARQEFITVDGRRVEYWITRSPGAKAVGPQAVVLFFVGKGVQTQRWIGAVADAWGKWPVEVWGMNYPGCGGTEGAPSLKQVAPDALAFYDAARKKAGDRPIFIQSASFGTAVALCVAVRRPVGGLILQNPPPLRQLILGHYGWWNLWLIAGPMASQVPDDLDSLANGAHATAPAIFISATGDSLIPASYHRRVAEAYTGPHRIIEMPGGHDSPLTHEAAEKLDAGREWLWQQSGARSP